MNDKKKNELDSEQLAGVSGGRHDNPGFLWKCITCGKEYSKIPSDVQSTVYPCTSQGHTVMRYVL